MVFSSPIFLFLFLPVTLLLTYLTHKYNFRNLVLLILSIFFYVFGEGELILLMMGSIVLNFFIGQWVGSAKTKIPIVVGITINILVLIIYKYLSFIIGSLNDVFILFGSFQIKQVNVKLPAGISFYTFHILSYLIDVSRKQFKPQKSFVDLALYICLFPQLIAGPIVRYKDVAKQIMGRTLTSDLFRAGIERFIIGLGKKMIIANTLATAADTAFGCNPQDLTAPAAWFGILCYTLQLYFDFSAYSDMAIGLGKMLGFNFLENFRFPYKSTSIREFWQRWHISLSNWFRDYLYIPLGGNKKSNFRTYLNLYIVFFLTGLWHGASWNFVIWGLAHGTLMVIERLGFGRILEKLPRIVQHFYMLSSVILLWVFFRADHLSGAMGFVQTMFGKWNTGTYTLAMLTDTEIVAIFIIGVIMSVNGFNWLLKKMYKFSILYSVNGPLINSVFRFNRVAFLLMILIYSGMIMATGSYNPFIYFRF